MSDGYKVIVLGLDGATFDLMLPWMEEGHLPAIAELVETGARSPLESTIPPHTPCAWSSFITGKNPGKHGLLDFVEPVPGSHDFRFTNASSRAGSSLWSLINRHGLKTGVVNVPMTFPPEKVDGYLVSGLDAPHEQSEFTYPATIRDEIAARSIDYRIDLQHMGDMGTYAKCRSRLAEICEIETARTEAFEYLRRQYPSEFQMLVYTATDRVQHHFWHYMDPSHDKYDSEGAELFRNAIRDVYVHVDHLIARVLDGKDRDTIVMTMSDHGFGPTSSLRLRLNQSLAHREHLRFQREGGASRVKRMLAGAVDRLLRSTLSCDFKRKLAARFPRLRVWFENLDEARLEWSETIAFASEFYRASPAIWINRSGRFPDGTVGDGAEYEAALETTAAALLSITDSSTGERAINKVYRTRDIYEGPFVDRAPDLIPSWWDDGFLIEQSDPHGGPQGDAFRAEGDLWRGVEFTGSHRLDGIFTMTGGPVKPGYVFEGAKITDVAPTVLYMMGLPIPADMDGSPLLQAIDPLWVDENPPLMTGDASDESAPSDAYQDFSSDEAEAVAQRLKALGYI